MPFAGRVDWRGHALEMSQAERFVASLGSRNELQVDFPDGALFAHRLTLNLSQKTNKAQSPEDNSRLMFSGYLSNRDDLAASLQLGFNAEKLPDCVYVKLALDRWGSDAPEHLEGSFALAYWQPDTRQLLLSCDHIGFRPLYYHVGDGWIAFATTPMPILTLPDISALPDERRLANCLTALTDEPGRSFFSGIRRVPAASTLLFAGDVPIIKRYWQPDFHRRLYYRCDEDYVEAARELLDRAVRVHSRDAGKVSVEISGGLDSSAVAATAARLFAPSPTNTLTALPAEGIALPTWGANALYLNERPYIEAIARMHPNLHPTFLASSPSQIHAWEQDWTVNFRLSGMPIPNPLNLAWFFPIYRHICDTGVSTLLSGLAGNLSLSWDGRSGLISMARAGQWLWVLRELQALSKSSGLSFARLLCGTVLRSKLPPAVGQAVDRLRRKAPALWALAPINPEFAEYLNIPERTAERMRMQNDGSASLRRWHFELMQDRADHGAQWQHMIGCDYRHPLADRRLLEYCFAVPENQYLRNGVTRFLARRVLADRLPPEVINNTQRGIQCPDAFQRMHYRRDAIVSGVEELERSSVACRILDIPRMKALATHWPTDPVAAGLEYQNVLYRGLQYGQFLRWIENGAA